MENLLNNKFIIIRGPSASGKTTVAKEIFKKAKNKTVLIEQDHYRFIFKPAGGGSKPNSEIIHKMIEHNASTALKHGYNVILEGILSVKSYQKIIEKLIKSHEGESFIFYFDVSFKETLKRHQNKKESKEYGEEKMKKWYPSAHKSGHELEILLPESYSEKQTLEKILKISNI